MSHYLLAWVPTLPVCAVLGAALLAVDLFIAFNIPALR